MSPPCIGGGELGHGLLRVGLQDDDVGGVAPARQVERPGPDHVVRLGEQVRDHVQVALVWGKKLQ